MASQNPFNWKDSATDQGDSEGYVDHKYFSTVLFLVEAGNKWYTKYTVADIGSMLKILDEFTSENKIIDYDALSKIIGTKKIDGNIQKLLPNLLSDALKVATSDRTGKMGRRNRTVATEFVTRHQKKSPLDESISEVVGTEKKYTEGELRYKIAEIITKMPGEEIAVGNVRALLPEPMKKVSSDKLKRLVTEYVQKLNEEDEKNEEEANKNRHESVDQQGKVSDTMVYSFLSKQMTHNNLKSLKFGDVKHALVANYTGGKFKREQVNGQLTKILDGVVKSMQPLTIRNDMGVKEVMAELNKKYGTEDFVPESLVKLLSFFKHTQKDLLAYVMKFVDNDVADTDTANKKLKTMMKQRFPNMSNEEFKKIKTNPRFRLKLDTKRMRNTFLDTIESLISDDPNVKITLEKILSKIGDSQIKVAEASGVKLKSLYESVIASKEMEVILDKREKILQLKNQIGKHMVEDHTKKDKKQPAKKLQADPNFVNKCIRYLTHSRTV